MSTTTLARLSTTPTSARTLLHTSTPKPILKRPTPLPLSPSPFPFTASFSVYITPSATSPHVHFAPSPRLVSTYTTHSPNTYDRAPISVSPNPLALPAWGDRVYSPTLDGFKLADPPKLLPLTMLQYESPTITEFEDPRSPKPQTQKKKQKQSNNRISSELPKQPGRKPTELGKALSSYPRSPYPSAPLSPVDFEHAMDEEFSLREKAATRRTSSLDDKHSKRKNRSPTNLKVKPVVSFTLVPSPLGNMAYLSPAVERNPKDSKKPAPLSLSPSDNIVQGVEVASSSSMSSKSSRLSQAFWQSVSLASDREEWTEDGLEEGMTSYSQYPMFPTSIIHEGTDDHHHDQPEFMFASREGVLWSPGLPRKPRPGKTSSTCTKDDVSSQLLNFGQLKSPGLTQVHFGLGSKFTGRGISRSIVASPSPNDPKASFQSFSAALAEVTYPPPVRLVEKSNAIRNRKSTIESSHSKPTEVVKKLEHSEETM